MPMVQPVISRSDEFARSSYCRAFFLCERSAGDLPDEMGNAALTKFDANYLDGEAWANAGWLTTGNSSITDYMTRVAGAGHAFDCTSLTAIISMRLKKATPGSNETIAGCFTSGSADGGWQILANSIGTVAWQGKPADGGSASTLTIASGYAPLDGNGHTLCWFIPRDAVSAQMFVDGLSAGTSGMAASTRNYNGGHGFSLGAALAGSAKTAQFASVQIYTIDRNLASLKTQQIAAWMHRYPHRAVPDWLMLA